MILLLQTAQGIHVRLDKAIYGMSIYDRFAIAITFSAQLFIGIGIMSINIPDAKKERKRSFSYI